MKVFVPTDDGVMGIGGTNNRIALTNIPCHGGVVRLVTLNPQGVFYKFGDENVEIYSSTASLLPVGIIDYVKIPEGATHIVFTTSSSSAGSVTVGYVED